MRILLVEDDAMLGDGLQQGLIQEGHTVEWLSDGKTAEGALQADPFDAVVLDLMLPGQSGFDLLAAWRRNGHQVPVLILTALDAVDERIHGLDSGADDYLVKPVDLGELAARLRALARRAAGRTDNLLKSGDLSIDLLCHSATLAGQPLQLSRHEVALLEMLLERAGQAVSRDHLEAQLYGWSDGPDSNSLEVHIHRLRRKLGRDRIETVRGLGYRLALAP